MDTQLVQLSLDGVLSLLPSNAMLPLALADKPSLFELAHEFVLFLAHSLYYHTMHPEGQALPPPPPLPRKESKARE